MKNTLSLIAFSLIAFFIVSCSGGQGPEVAAKAYLDAINAQEFDKAKEFATEDSKGMIDIMKQISAMSGEKKEATEKQVVNDLKCKIEGDTTAVCTYLTLEKEEKTINLKKVADKWLVSMPKENPMGGGEEGTPMEAADTTSTAVDTSYSAKSEK
jgi:PBP1b-binding outer membrane lipoprotein LpoB